jgi:uncharacterized protein (DUF2062 family)
LIDVLDIPQSPLVTKVKSDAGSKPSSEESGFLRRRIVAPISRQLTQGTTPRKLALTVALGATIGLFPILGATSLLALGVGTMARLNQPVIQAANFAVTPLFLPLVLVYVRCGEYLVGAEQMPFRPEQLVSEFQASPAAFMAKFGMSGLHGIFAWALSAPMLIMMVFFVLHPVFRRMKRRAVVVPASDE